MYVDPSGLIPKIIDLVKYTPGYILFDFLTSTDELGKAWFSGTLGAEKDSQGIYHIKQDGWQSSNIVGYNDLYDVAFAMGTDMKKEKFEFEHNNEQMAFWAWKGDYVALGAGAEMGIYHGGGPHWKTGTEYAMPMTLTLLDKNQKEMFKWEPTEDNWWITGFDQKAKNVKANDITAIYTVDFSKNKDMYSAFKNSINDEETRWTFDSKKYTATFTF